MTDIGYMVRSANPVQDESQQLTDDELSAVLLLAQQRSGGMDTKQAPPVVAPEKKNRNGWLVAAAAFALVLVVVGASLLLADDAEAPPATTPPTTAAVTPTTEAAPPTTVSEVVDASVSDSTEQIRRDAVDRLLALATGGDMDSLTSELEGASASLRLERAGVQTANLAQSRSQLALESALGTRFAADSCTMGESPTRIECVVLATEPVRDALGLEALDMLLKADVDEQGEVTWFLWQWGIEANQYTVDSLWLDELEPFTTWLEATHPGDVDSMIALGAGQFYKPSISAESVALWAQRVPEFLETVDTNDGSELTPETAAIVDGLEAGHESGDSQAYRALHHPEFVRENDEGQTVPLDLVVTEMESIYSQGSMIDFYACKPLDGGFGCSYDVTGPVEDAIYAGEPFSSYMRYWVDDDGLISRIYLERTSGWSAYFIAWLQVDHPDEFAAVEARHPHLYVADDWPIWVEYAPIWAEAGRPIVTP